MDDDAQLLRRYVEQRSDAAFQEIVRRHIDHVYATALRRVGGDTHLAEDVAQQVFTALARKASSLRGHASLGGWLHLCAQKAAAAVVRGEQRRKARETEHHTMQAPSSSDREADLAPLRPALDDALVSLKPDERDAIVLRFFQQRSFAEVGAALRVSDDAARKRVDRALEKLRALLARRGLTSTTAAVSAALATSTAITVAEGLSAKIAGHALAQGAAGAGVFTLATLKTVVPIAAALVLGTGAVLQHRANRELRSELAGLETAAREVAALRVENRDLARDIARAEEIRRAQARRPVQVAASTRPAAPPSAASATPPVGAFASVNNIGVTAQGTLSWGGNSITLGEFTRLLQASAAAGDSQGAMVLVEAEDKAQISAVTYVVDEIRKTGIRAEIRTRAVPTPEIQWFRPRP